MKKTRISLISAFAIYCLCAIFSLASCAGEHNHTNASPKIENKVDATCDAEGSYDEVVYCLDCGKEISRTKKTTDRLEHVPSDWIIDADPTCIKEGAKRKECLECGFSIEYDTIDELAGHTSGDWIIDIDSTCKAEGARHKECNVCGISLEHGTIDKLTAHTASDWIIDSDPICNEKGAKHKECTVCSVTLESEPIPETNIHTEVVDEAIDPTETTEGLTKGSHCKICGYVIKAQEVIPNLSYGDCSVYSKIMTLSGTALSAKLSNTTDEFSFINDITVPYGASYVIATDPSCTQTIPSKTVTLGTGDNTFFILVTNADKTKLYTVTIRRLPLYSVAFKSDAETSAAIQTIEEGSLAEIPADPAKAGYTFAGWDFDFSTPITCDKTINAKWNARTDTPYKVEYYLQNLTKTDYDLIETVDLKSTTDTVASADIKIIDHFTHIPTAIGTNLSGTVSGDGSLVLKVYYTRDTYNITASVENSKSGFVTSGGTYPYGTEITLAATVNAGYTFVGFMLGEDTVCHTTKYTFTVNKDLDLVMLATPENTPYRIEYYLENVTLTGFDLHETVSLESATDSTVYADIKTFDHFMHNENINGTKLGGRVSGDGSLVLRVYYTRNSYYIWTKSNDANFGSVLGDGSYPYGTEITLTTVPSNGYTCTEWYIGDKYFSSGSSCTFVIDDHKTLTAKFEAADEMKNFNFSTHNGRCIIISVKDTTITSVIIPDYVTIIGSNAFSKCSNLTSVTLGSGVVEIRDGAFAGCKRLKSINIPDGTATIDDSAFSGCRSLSKITIPNSVESIGEYAFRDCEGLLEITIPDSVTSIGKCAFYNCKSLKSASVGNGVTTISESMFNSCSSLASVVIENGATEIDYQAFRRCESLDSITIPDSVTSIGQYAFYGCSGLASVNLGNGLLEIGESAFSSCINLSEIIIPNSTVSIGSYAFNGCNLEEVIIPDGVTSIARYTFSGCSNLTSITIGSGIKNIESNAFYECYRLVEIINKSELDITAGAGYFGNGAFYAIEVHTGESKVLKQDDYIFYSYNGVNYLVDYKGSESDVTLPENYNGQKYEIHDYAFYDRDNLISLIIPDGVTSIARYTFSGCSNLTSITIGSGIKNIGNNAFYECYRLVEIINKSALKIAAGSGIALYAIEVHPAESRIVKQDDYIFYTYDGVNYLVGYIGNETDIALPETYNGQKYEIYNYAFHGRKNLTSAVITDGVTSIGSYAFWNCENLESINIPDSVTSIGDHAFSVCSNLTSVTLGSGIVEIRDWAFSGCQSLKSINIPDGIATIDDGTFSGCRSLSKITLPNSVESIGECAFRDCEGLLEITIPDSVTSIGNKAFYGLDLTSITIPSGVMYIGKYAFIQCAYLSNIVFEDTASWYCTKSASFTDGTHIDVTDAATNATYLGHTYHDYYWYKAQSH